jgi:predicted transcriptional regulator
VNKTVNMTIRIDPDLKAKAEEACEYLDLTLSMVMRTALQNIVRDYQAKRIKDTEYARYFHDGDLAERAQAALVREMQQEAVVESKKTGKRVVAPTLIDLVKGRPVSDDDVPVKHGSMPSNSLINEQGEVDPTKLNREMRRAYERDKSKGRI